MRFLVYSLILVLTSCVIKVKPDYTHPWLPKYSEIGAGVFGMVVNDSTAWAYTEARNDPQVGIGNDSIIRFSLTTIPYQYPGSNFELDSLNIHLSMALDSLETFNGKLEVPIGGGSHHSVTLIKQAVDESGNLGEKKILPGFGTFYLRNIENSGWGEYVVSGTFGFTFLNEHGVEEIVLSHGRFDHTVMF